MRAAALEKQDLRGGGTRGGRSGKRGKLPCLLEMRSDGERARVPVEGDI